MDDSASGGGVSWVHAGAWWVVSQSDGGGCFEGCVSLVIWSVGLGIAAGIALSPVGWVLGAVLLAILLVVGVVKVLFSGLNSVAESASHAIASPPRHAQWDGAPPQDGPRPILVVGIIAVVIIVIAIAVSGSRHDDLASLQQPSTTYPIEARPTAAMDEGVPPLSPAESIQPAEPTPGPRTTQRDLERLLLDRMAFTSCKPWRKRGQERDPFSFEARAGVQCDDPDLGIRQAAMFIFPSPQSMTGYWAWRVGRIKPSPPRRPAGCEIGERALQRWTHGELACYVDQTGDPRLAKIRWTDERDNTYGILDGDDRSIKELYERWSTMTG